MALLFVLGATWTFGVLHILHETTLTAYLFTITNTFQGMFIFIFLCVLSRKVRLWFGFFSFVFDFCISWPVRHLVFTTIECKKVHHPAFCMCSLQIQEEYYRLFKNVPCCFECLRWINAARAWSSARLLHVSFDTTAPQLPVTLAFTFGETWEEVFCADIILHFFSLLKDLQNSKIWMSIQWPLQTWNCINKHKRNQYNM